VLQDATNRSVNQDLSAAATPDMELMNKQVRFDSPNALDNENQLQNHAAQEEAVIEVHAHGLEEVGQYVPNSDQKASPAAPA